MSRAARIGASRAARVAAAFVLGTSMLLGLSAPSRAHSANRYPPSLLCVHTDGLCDWAPVLPPTGGRIVVAGDSLRHVQEATVWGRSVQFRATSDTSITIQVPRHTAGQTRIRVRSAGQWSNGLTLSMSVPTTAETSAGEDYTCWVTTDHAGWCTGFTHNGVLGPNGGSNRVQENMAWIPGRWRTIQAGFMDTCGIKTDDSLWCWGDNQEGQLGPNGPNPGKSGTHPRPVKIPGSWSEVAVGTLEATCALDISGSVWCWGMNWTGDLGPNFVPAHHGGLWSDALSQIPGVWTGGLSFGDSHVCALQSTSLWCWGSDGDGELGPNGPGSSHSSADPVLVDGTWSAVTAGGDHTCGLLADQTVWCWGRNYFGELGPNGDPDRHHHYQPNPVQEPGLWNAIDAGTDHTCGIRTTGQGFCWGSNEWNQIGRTKNIGTRKPNPTLGAIGKKWTSISAGGQFTFGVLKDGSTNEFGVYFPF